MKLPRVFLLKISFLTRVAEDMSLNSLAWGDAAQMTQLPSAVLFFFSSCKAIFEVGERQQIRQSSLAPAFNLSWVYILAFICFECIFK